MAQGRELFLNLFVLLFKLLLRLSEGRQANSSRPGCVPSLIIFLALLRHCKLTASSREGGDSQWFSLLWGETPAGLRRRGNLSSESVPMVTDSVILTLLSLINLNFLSVSSLWLLWHSVISSFTQSVPRTRCFVDLPVDGGCVSWQGVWHTSAWRNICSFQDVYFCFYRFSSVH